MKRHALLIGINGYRDPGFNRLRFAERDANELAKLLRQRYDFSTRVLAGPRATRSAIREVLEGRSLAPASPPFSAGDQFLLFFAGHGELVDGQYVLHPWDGKPGTWLDALPMKYLNECLAGRMLCREVMCVLDACRSVAIAGARGAAGFDQESFARDVRIVLEADPGDHLVQILYGCSDGERSWEDARFEHGVLTQYLKQVLSNKDGDLSFVSLAEEATDEVGAWRHPEHGARQTPHLYYRPTKRRIWLRGTGLVREQENGVQRERELAFSDAYSQTIAAAIAEDWPGTAKGCARALELCDDLGTKHRLRSLREHAERLSKPTSDRASDLKSLASLLEQLAKEVARGEEEVRTQEEKERLVREQIKKHQNDIAQLNARKKQFATDRTRVNDLLRHLDDLLLRDDLAAAEGLLDEAARMAGESQELAARVAAKRAQVRARAQGPGQIKEHRGINYVLIQAGEFEMGPSESATLARVAEPFWISETPITAEAYSQVRRVAIQTYPDHPAFRVSWNQASRYCREVDGRLPNEIEWEFAARGGLDRCDFPWGRTANPGLANYSGQGTCQVKSYPANGFGLFDVAGNVWEWCEDLFSKGQRRRVVRGGSWRENAAACKVWERRGLHADKGYDDVGFRCVLPV